MQSKLHFITVLAAIAIFGVGTSLACSQERIQQCVQHIQQLDTSQINTETCKAVGDVVECIKRETSTCDANIRAALVNALNMLDSMEELCQKAMVDGGLAGIDMETCDAKKLEACATRVQSSASSQLPCTALAEIKKCIDDFRKECKSELFLGMINNLMGMIEEPSRQCNLDVDSDGTSETGGNTDGDSSTSQGRVGVQEKSGKSEGSYNTDNNEKVKVNDNNNNGGIGNGNTVQPTLPALVFTSAAALWVAVRRFV